MDAVDLVEFLKARIDEDEELARSCPSWEWRVDGPPGGTEMLEGHTGPGRWGHLAEPKYQTGRALHHAAHWDPIRVVAEVEAKRRIIALHSATEGLDEPNCTQCDYRRFPCPTLKLLALSYADHPDFEDGWRV